MPNYCNLCHTYRLSTRLFVVGEQKLKSSEGTTQSDPLSMAIYAFSLQPLITSLHITSSTKQCWFADDATGAGMATESKKWWDVLMTEGPDYGYNPKEDKCWLITKPETEEIIRETFNDTEINITNEGKKHLGAVVGSRSYLTEYVNEKVDGLVNEIIKLAEFATTYFQASYAVYTFGLKHRWTYCYRTLSNIQALLQPLEVQLQISFCQLWLIAIVPQLSETFWLYQLEKGVLEWQIHAVKHC